MQKRKTKITVESHQVTVIRRGKQVVRIWCEGCGGQVEMVAAEQAAILRGLSLRSLLRHVEAAGLHFTEDAEGRLFICLHSLMNCI